MVLVVVLVLVLLAVFLQRVLDLQRNMERVIVDAEVANLRTELQLQVASMIVHGRDAELAGWVRQNPLQLVAREVDGLSPTAPVPRFSLSSEWRWDEGMAALTYTYADGEELRLRVGRLPRDAGEGWLLGSGLVLLRERREGGK